MKLRDKIKSELKNRIEMCKSLAPKDPNPLDINVMGMIAETYMSVIRYIDTIDDDDFEIDGDLEEVAQKYENNFDVDGSQQYLYTVRGDLKDAVIYGANYQKERSQKLIEMASNVAANEVVKNILENSSKCEILGKSEEDNSTIVKIEGCIQQVSVGETMKVVLIKND